MAGVVRRVIIQEDGLARVQYFVSAREEIIQKIPAEAFSAGTKTFVEGEFENRKNPGKSDLQPVRTAFNLVDPNGVKDPLT